MKTLFMDTTEKTGCLPPDLAVRIAWALTLQMSEAESLRMEVNRTKQLMEEIKEKAKESKKEEQYVNLSSSAIESTFRNLVIIINGRNLNFNEVKALRDKSIENIQYYSQFSSDLQSLIPRLSGMTIGGVSASVFLTKVIEPFFPPDLRAYALPLLLAAGAAIGYFLNGLIVVPIVRRKNMMENIKMDYERDLYYAQYVERSKIALINLYQSVDRYHRIVFGDRYDPKVDISAIVEEVLGGVNPTVCKYAVEHMAAGFITPNLWSMCEMGLESAAKKCPHWKG